MLNSASVASEGKNIRFVVWNMDFLGGGKKRDSIRRISGDISTLESVRTVCTEKY